MKDDFAESDLRAKQSFSTNRSKKNYPSEAQVEKEFFYDNEWNSLVPGVVWAYLLSNVCKSSDISRQSLEKGSIPIPRFMGKGTGILEALLILSVVNLPFGSGDVAVESNNKLGLIFTAPYDVLIYRDFFKKSDFQLTNTTIVRCNLYSNIQRGDKKYITDEDPLWTDAVYQCDIVLTNLTAVEQQYQVNNLLNFIKYRYCSKSHKAVSQSMTTEL